MPVGNRPALQLPMPFCNRPALQMPMPYKWRESRANGGSLGEMEGESGNALAFAYARF